MFTGIIEEIGTVLAVEHGEGEDARVTIGASEVLTDARHGCSISAVRIPPP